MWAIRYTPWRLYSLARNAATALNLTSPFPSSHPTNSIPPAQWHIYIPGFKRHRNNGDTDATGTSWYRTAHAIAGAPCSDDRRFPAL